MDLVTKIDESKLIGWILCGEKCAVTVNGCWFLVSYRAPCFELGRIGSSLTFHQRFDCEILIDWRDDSNYLIWKNESNCVFSSRFWRECQPLADVSKLPVFNAAIKPFATIQKWFFFSKSARCNSEIMRKNMYVASTAQHDYSNCATRHAIVFLLTDVTFECPVDVFRWLESNKPQMNCEMIAPLLLIHSTDCGEVSMHLRKSHFFTGNSWKLSRKRDHHALTQHWATWCGTNENPETISKLNGRFGALNVAWILGYFTKFRIGNLGLNWKRKKRFIFDDRTRKIREENFNSITSTDYLQWFAVEITTFQRR